MQCRKLTTFVVILPPVTDEFLAGNNAEPVLVQAHIAKATIKILKNPFRVSWPGLINSSFT